MADNKDMGELLDALAWGHRVVEIDDGRVFVFRPLTLEERNVANFVYHQATKDGKANHLLNRQALEKNAISTGLWKPSYANDIRLLRQELGVRLEEMQEEEKANSRRQTETGKLKGLRKRVSYISLKLRELEDLHTQHIELPSVEYYSERERGIYALSRSAMAFPEMKQIWGSLDALKDEEDTILVAKLLNLYYDVKIAEESEIRKLARSPIWRIRWMGSKKNGGVKTLFGKDMYDITLDQFRLVYWSQIYDSAFESLESPSDEIVENDKLFDEWLEEQSNKRRQERKKSELDKKTSRFMGDGQEVGVDPQGFYSEHCNCGVKQMKKRLGHLHAPSCPYGVYIYYSKAFREKKVEEIQSANPDSIRRILAKEQRTLADKGDMIEEQHLRADSKVRAAFGMPTKVSGSDDRGRRGRARH